MANQKLSNPEDDNPVKPIPDTASSPGDIQLWRQQLVRGILRALVAVMLPALAVGAYDIYQRGNIWQIPIILVAFAGIVFVTFWRRSPYTLQAGIILLTCYLIGGVSDMLNYGITGDGVLFLLTASALTLLFLGRRMGILALVVAGLTLGAFGWAYSTGQLVIPAETLTRRNVEAIPWLTHTLLFLALGSLLVLAQNYLFVHLTAALARSQGLTRQLEVIRENLEQRVAERTAALERSSNYLVALQDTALGLVSRLNVDELLQAIVSRAGGLVGTEHGYVFLLDPQSGEMKMRVGLGTYSGLVGTQARPGVGLAGTVWQTGQPLAVDDYRHWPSRLPGAERERLQSVVGVPLKSRASVVGVIGLAYVEPGRTFGASEVEVLGRFAQLASIALDNARLYTEQAALAEENRQFLERAEQTAAENRQLLERAEQTAAENRQLYERAQQVVEEMSALTRRLTGEGWEEYLAARQEEFLVEDAKPDLGLRQHKPQALAQALTEANPVTCTSENGRAVALPIVVRGQVIGSLAVENENPQSELKPYDLEALQDIAEHVALALESARLFEQTQVALAETRRRAAREAELSKINDRLHATTDMKVILQTAAEELRRTTGGAFAFIRLNRNDAAKEKETA